MAVILHRETRPDLAVGLSQKTLGGAARMLAPILFPRFTVSERGGTIAVAQVLTSNGVKNRAQGDALTGTRAAQTDITYAVAKYEDRALLDDRDIKDHGSTDAAVNAGASIAAYGAMKKVETDAAAKLFTAARYAAAGAIESSSPFAALMDAADGVKRYGAPHLVCSEAWLNKFVKLPSVAEVLLKLYGDKIIAGVVAGVADALKAVGSHFAVVDISIGDNDFWKVGAGTGTDYSDAAAIVGLRPEMATDPRLTAKMLPVYGFSPVYLPESDSSLDCPFEIQTGYLDSSKDNYVDATLYADLCEANAGGAKLVKLPA